MLVSWFRCLSWIRSSDWLRSLRSIRPSGLPPFFTKLARRCPFNSQRQREALSDRGFVPLQHGVLNSRRLQEASIPLNPDAFISVLVEQASDIGWTLTQLISKHVPSLSKLIISH